METAPEAGRSYLRTALANNGSLPNLVASLTEARDSLEAYLTLGQISGRCGLTLAEREVVQITAATIHGCACCVAGHTAIALKKPDLASDLVTAFRGNRPLSDTRLNTIAIFTRSVIAMHGAVDGQSLEEFRNAGLTEANALEIELGVSLATLCNFANNLTQNEMNAELQDFRWTPT
ncbi:carboxymuconolactone decarboxylase family protein [Paraburkholderia sp. IMGN_8]|uniref:carboxymuconolactone decarboxylase family protein n=1 Tax=Paraburkholderia sp. IMGN_8 TaxID=3136564 RepID=UPI003100F39D